MYKGLVILFFLLISSYSLAQQTPRKQALLVGVSNYQGDHYDLRGIDNDIKKMHKLFRSWGFDVKILQDEESFYLSHYLHAYSSGPNQLAEGDLFAFYFSGHGSYVKDLDGIDNEKDGRDETLVLSNGHTNVHFIDDNLNYYLSRIKARKIEIFDSCHSGTVNKGGNAKNKGMQKTIPPNKVQKISNQLLRKITPINDDNETCHIVSYCQRTNSNNTIKPLNLFNFCYCGSLTKGRLPASQISFSSTQTPPLSKKTVNKGNGDTITFAASTDSEKALSKASGSPFTNEFYIQFSSRFNQQRRTLQSVHTDIADNITIYCRIHGENDYTPQFSASKQALKKMTMENYLRIGR